VYQEQSRVQGIAILKPGYSKEKTTDIYMII